MSEQVPRAWHQSELRDLRRALARLYPDRRTVMRVLSDAGLPLQRIDLHGSTEDLWFQALQEALRLDALGYILEVALDEYPDDDALRKAVSGEPDRWEATPEPSGEGPSADLVCTLRHLSSDEVKAVRRLLLKLIEAGIRPLVVEDESTPGAPITDALDDGVRKTLGGVLVLTSRTISEGWTDVLEQRYRRAHRPGGEYLIVPLLLDDSEVPEHLLVRSVIDLRDVPAGGALPNRIDVQAGQLADAFARMRRGEPAEVGSVLWDRLVDFVRRAVA